jgi:hypothetical protein
MTRSLVSAVLVTSLVSGCLPEALPPPVAPEQVMPPLPAAAPQEAGKGQATIDADEPALVEEVTGHAEGITPDGWPVSELTYRTVCPATPCAANLELGDHDLRFTSLADPSHGSGTGSITVGPQPTNYRYALGHNVDPTLGWIAPFILGTGAVVAGITFTAIGQTTTLDDHANTIPGPNVRPAGLVTMGVGVALTTLALYLWSHDRGATQPGTGVQWTPAAP